MALKTLAELFYADRDTDFGEAFWNRFVAELQARFTVLESIKIDWEVVSQQGLQVAIDRINEVLVPAAERIQAVAALGFLQAPSATPVTLGLGIKSFVVSPGDQRDLFTPSPFAAITREATPYDYAVGRVTYWNRETGVIDIDVSYFSGNPGPHSDWVIAGVAGQALAEADILTDVEAARDAAVASEAAAEAAQAATEAARDLTLAAAGRYYGALSAPPGGAVIGSQYLDTSVTPNIVKVLTSTGWAPTVTVSIGGSRSQDYAAATGAEGVGPFAVSGGFTFGDVYLNGVKLRKDLEVTFSPGPGGTFTLSEPLAALDLMEFRGYLANDSVDIYTKAEAQNIASRGILSGFRNKIINSRFEILLRANGITAPGYVCDRWKILTFGTGATGPSAIVSAPNAAAYAVGRRNILVWDRTAGTTLSRLQQAIEGVETLAGKEVTIAILGYASTAGMQLTLRLDQDFGTGGSPSAVVQGTAGTVTLPTGAPSGIVFFKTTLASIAGKTLGTNGNDCLLLNIDSPAAGAFGIRILDVAVVEGDATTESEPFAYRGRALETVLCQRYYEVLGSMRVQNPNTASAISLRSTWHFKVTKRATPTMTAQIGALEYANAQSAVFLQNTAANTTYDTGICTADAELI